MKNHYEILGVSPEATAEEINKAYKKLAQKYHPDVTNNDPLLASKFEDITEAREVLTNEEKREEFNWLLNNFSIDELNPEEIQELQRRQAEEDRKKRREHFKRAKSFKKITLLIIFIGCVFVIVNLLWETKEDETEFVMNTSNEIQPEIQTKVAEKDTSRRDVSVREIKTSGLEKPVEPSAVTRPVASLQAKKKSNSTLPASQKPKAPKTRIEKSLTYQEMAKVLRKMDMEKAASRVTTRCVKVVKTKTSNIVNGFDLARFLQANGYVISGREIRESSRKGITVDTKGSCITVLIGTL